MIIGAGGSVGSAAVQLAKHYGAHVTGMASGPRREAVMGLGADEFIDYTSTPMRAISQRFDLIFDAAGKAFPPLSENLEPTWAISDLDYTRFCCCIT